MNDFYSVAEELRSAQKAGDRGRLSALLHEDVVWVLPGDNAISGEARGIAAVFTRFDRLAGYGVHIDVEHITVGRDGAALIMHNTGEHGGRTLDEHLVSTMTIQNRQITRMDSYVSDVEMMNAYFV